MDYRKRIIVDPKIMIGKPVIRGTRIPVDEILKRLAEGQTENEILEDYPRLKRNNIKAALAYATQLVRSEDIRPLVREQHAVSH